MPRVIVKKQEKTQCTGQNPLVKQCLKKYFQVKQCLNAYFFHGKPIALTTNDTLAAYNPIYNLSNEENYQPFSLSFMRQFKADVQSFTRSLYDKLVVASTLSPVDYVDTLFNQIANFTRYTHWVYKLFICVDKAFIDKKEISLLFQALGIAKDTLITPIFDTLYDKIWGCIALFRNNQLKSTIALNHCIRFIGALGFTKFRHLQLIKAKERFEFVSQQRDTQATIEVEFETDYFKQTFLHRFITDMRDYYHGVAGQVFLLSVPQYLATTEEILAKESIMIDEIVPDASVKDMILKNFIERFIVNKGQALLQNPRSGLRVVMENRDFKTVRRFYTLFKRGGIEKIFFRDLQTYIVNYGQNIINKITPEEQKMMKKEAIAVVLNEVLRFSVEINEIVKVLDPMDNVLVNHINTAFQIFCNKGNKLCTFTAHYVDYVLKKEASNEQLQELKQRVATLTKYFYSYDSFIKIHQKLLGTRILYNGFQNIVIEEDILNLFKNEAGVTSVAKIGNMVSDHRASQAWNETICKSTNKEFGFNMQVMMLTSGLWDVPDPKNGTQLVPKSLLPAVQAYQTTFKKLMPNRKVTWIFHHGRAIVRALFQQPYVLVLNNYQLLTLLHMEQHQFCPMQVRELMMRLQICDEAFFIKSINSLLKTGVLVRKEANMAARIESNEDQVVYNKNLKSKTQKITCMVLPKMAEKTLVNMEVSLERNCITDAAIIKVLKQRRRIQFNELVGEVQKICKNFKADIAFIKQRIENCQDRNFVERDAQNMNMLIYIP